MPHSKDLRCGEGWYDVNVNSFFDWFEDTFYQEIIVKSNFGKGEFQYHKKILEDEIEERVNEYIDYKLFGTERNPLDEEDVTLLPSNYNDVQRNVWYYVSDHVKRFIKQRPDWYTIKDL